MYSRMVKKRRQKIEFLNSMGDYTRVPEVEKEIKELFKLDYNL
jgi:predicted CopG family antitoxin